MVLLCAGGGGTRLIPPRGLWTGDASMADKEFLGAVGMLELSPRQPPFSVLM